MAQKHKLIRQNEIKSLEESLTQLRAKMAASEGLAESYRATSEVALESNWELTAQEQSQHLQKLNENSSREIVSLKAQIVSA
jgi:hypothetical protein